MIYIYQHPETGEIEEVVQSMNDEHVFFKDGIKWNRVFTKPYASIDSKIDPNSVKDFVSKTGSKKGTVGDMLDLSAELSEKRAEKHGGEDPIKRKYFDDYKKNTKGKKHLLDKPKKIKTDIATIEF